MQDLAKLNMFAAATVGLATFMPTRSSGYRATGLTYEPFEKKQNRRVKRKRQRQAKKKNRGM